MEKSPEGIKLYGDEDWYDILKCEPVTGIPALKNYCKIPHFNPKNGL